MAEHRPEQNLTAIDQIIQHLSDSVKAGEFTSGDRLPSRSVLARKFGISPGTVSIALRRLAKIHALEFKPGRGVFLAGEDAAKDRLNIGLIGRYASTSADDMNGAGVRRHGYWPAILHSIVSCCAKRNYAVVVIPETMQEPLDLDRVLSHRVGCLISHGLDLHRSTILEIKRRGIPLILGRRPNDRVLSVGVSYVDYDWVGGLRQSLKIFSERGHDRVACIAVPQIEGTCERWREVFFAQTAQLGLSSSHKEYCRVYPAAAVNRLPKTVHEFIRDECAALLALSEPPTAIFCSAFEDIIRPALDALAGRRITVGKELSLICLAPEWPQSPLTLSAFVEPAEDLGEKLVETASKLADDPHQVFHVDIPFDFTDKGSIAALNSGKEVMANTELSNEL